MVRDSLAHDPVSLDPGSWDPGYGMPRIRIWYPWVRNPAFPGFSILVFGTPGSKIPRTTTTTMTTTTSTRTLIVGHGPVRCHEPVRTRSRTRSKRRMSNAVSNFSLIFFMRKHVYFFLFSVYISKICLLFVCHYLILYLYFVYYSKGCFMS